MSLILIPTIKNVDPDLYKRIIYKTGVCITIYPNGIITPTPETVKTIIIFLLDHRLKSELSLGTFDVPSSVSIT